MPNDGSELYLRLTSADEARHRPPPPMPDLKVEHGKVVERSDFGQVRVELEQSGEMVSAARTDFPDGWVFEVGDLIAVERSAESLRTLPLFSSISVVEGVTVFEVANTDGAKRVLARDRREW